MDKSLLKIQTAEEKKETEDKIEAAMKEEVVLDLGEEEEWK